MNARVEGAVTNVIEKLKKPGQHKIIENHVTNSIILILNLSNSAG